MVLIKEMSMKFLKNFRNKKINCMYAIYNKVTRRSLYKPYIITKPYIKPYIMCPITWVATKPLHCGDNRRVHCFHDNIYILLILLLWDLSTLCVVDHLWPLIFVCRGSLMTTYICIIYFFEFLVVFCYFVFSFSSCYYLFNYIITTITTVAFINITVTVILEKSRGAESQAGNSSDMVCPYSSR